MNPGDLNKCLEIWGKVEFTNELNEKDFRDALIKTAWGGFDKVNQQTGNQIIGVADTIFSKTTHKIKLRYHTSKTLTEANWFMYEGHRFDIKYILDPFFKHESLEFFCEEVRGDG